MKTNIQELIEATDRLCASLDAASQNELGDSENFY